jgi:Outer membrane lipoprotein-sorting protein
MKSRLAVFAWSLLGVTGAFASTTNDLSDAKIQGRQLAQRLYDVQPAENFTNFGVLKIRGVSGKQIEIPLKCEVIITPTNWVNIYIVGRDSHSYLSLQYFFSTTNSSSVEILTITHADGLANRYSYDYISNPDRINSTTDKGVALANSDFLAMDLGLEFFHWPDQKILKSEMRRSRPCKVLESINPNPSTNGYSRVVSWIDNESNGIVHAEAYDVNGKLLKEFDPKSFKKVNGQWELQDMEIRNVQTGSRTRLEFDFKRQD